MHNDSAQSPIGSPDSPRPRRRMRRRKLHFARPDVGQAEFDAVQRVLQSGWLTSGPETQLFEEEFAMAVGAKEAVAVNSCTAALHLALAGWNLGPDDAVIVPAITFTASAEIVEYSGSLPLIVDVNRDDYLMDAELLEQYIQSECRVSKNGLLVHRASRKTVRALIPVHIGGRPCDLRAIQKLARKYKLKVLEDAAHAFPASYNGQTVGNIGHATAFSFYATKNLTTGEGGMLTTNDRRLAERVRRMRLHGIKGQTYGRKRWHYDVVEKGFKYNMPDMNAAIGRVQLSRTEETLAARRRVHEIYEAGLAGLPGIRRNPACAHASAHHLYTIEILPGKREKGGAGLKRDRFVEEMYARNIAVSLHFIPLYRLTRYRRTYQLKAKDFPNSERVYRNIVSLPIYSAMTDEDARDVVAAVREILGTVA